MSYKKVDKKYFEELYRTLSDVVGEAMARNPDKADIDVIKGIYKEFLRRRLESCILRNSGEEYVIQEELKKPD